MSFSLSRILRHACLLALTGAALINLHAAEDTPLPTDNPQVVALYNACDKGDLAEVKRLVAAGAPIDGQIGQIRCTPLMQAVYRSHPDVVQFLVDSHANPNVTDAQGSTALLDACAGGRADSVNILIAAGVNVSLGSHYGRTPLMYAAKTGKTEIVQALLKAHADLNANCDQGPALMWAVAQDKADCAKLLAEAGADVNLKPEHGSPDHFTELGAAVGWGDKALVDYLIDKGADVNGTAGSKGMTPILTAVDYGKPDMVEELIAKGADLNRKDSDGDTSVILACRKEFRDCLKVLIDHHANLDITDAKGAAAVVVAGNRGDTETVDLLKKGGAKNVDIHLVDHGDKPASITPGHAWALGVAIPYTQRAHMNVWTLGGDAEINDRKEMLKRDWKITDKDTLLKQLDELRFSGMRAEFQKTGAQLAALTDDQFAKFVAQHKDKAATLQAMRDGYNRWHEREGVAWDMCRAANLVNAGYTCHYLTEAEAWEQLMMIARQTQEAFQSWKEMSDNFLDGREIWNDKRDPEADARAALLLNPKETNSPWNHLDWSTNLAGD